MDLLVLPVLLFVVGSVISLFSKSFRNYWLVAISFATLGALVFQFAVYLQLGFLDPFYQIAFITSWFAFFGLITFGYLAYAAIKNQNKGEAGK